jgi:hypothetical protein
MQHHHERRAVAHALRPVQVESSADPPTSMLCVDCPTGMVCAAPGVPSA